MSCARDRVVPATDGLAGRRILYRRPSEPHRPGPAVTLTRRVLTPMISTPPMRVQATPSGGAPGPAPPPGPYGSPPRGYACGAGCLRLPAAGGDFPRGALPGRWNRRVPNRGAENCATSWSGPRTSSPSRRGNLLSYPDHRPVAGWGHPLAKPWGSAVPRAPAKAPRGSTALPGTRRPGAAQPRCGGRTPRPGAAQPPWRGAASPGGGRTPKPGAAQPRGGAARSAGNPGGGSTNGPYQMRYGPFGVSASRRWPNAPGCQPASRTMSACGPF